MKTLIALLFIAALPLMGQGRWINKQQYDSIYFGNKITTSAHPLAIQSAFVEWLNMQSHVKINHKNGGSSSSRGITYLAMGKSPSAFFYGYALGKYNEEKKLAYFHPDTSVAVMEFDPKYNSMKDVPIFVTLSVSENNDSSDFRVQVYTSLSSLVNDRTNKEAVEFAKNNDLAVYSNRFRKDAEKYILSKLK